MGHDRSRTDRQKENPMGHDRSRTDRRTTIARTLLFLGLAQPKEKVEERNRRWAARRPALVRTFLTLGLVLVIPNLYQTFSYFFGLPALPIHSGRALLVGLVGFGFLLAGWTLREDARTGSAVDEPHG